MKKSQSAVEMSGHFFMVGKKVTAKPSAIDMERYIYMVGQEVTVNPSAIGMISHFFMVGNEVTTRQLMELPTLWLLKILIKFLGAALLWNWEESSTCAVDSSLSLMDTGIIVITSFCKSRNGFLKSYLVLKNSHLL